MTVDYSTLKKATIEILDFTRSYIDDQDINLRTSVADDLSLWELDGYTFLENYEERFGVNLPDKVYAYVCPPQLMLRPVEKVLYVMLFFFTLPFFIVLHPLLPQDQMESTKQKIRRNAKRLTLGDLAATLVNGTFIKREEVKIVLSRH